MKRVVFLNELKESEIRPEAVYKEYKHIVSEDIQKHFSDPSALVRIDCPGCSDKFSKAVFNKMGFDYCACDKCGSLFVSPRPTDEALRAFYRNSKAGAFLRKNILENTLESRTKKVFSFRVQWIMGLIEEYCPDAEILLDYATKYPALLRELYDSGSFKSIVSVLSECDEQDELLPRNVSFIGKNEMVEGSVDIFAAFEFVERAFSPVELFKNAYNVCKKNGLFVVTSTTSSGFEYQVLGEYSPNIIPTDRLNLLSLEAMTGQMKKAEFEIIEVSTPGRLDVEMVKRTYERNPDIPLDPFWKYVFRNRQENALHSLQEYLQQFQLSSHVRIAAIKR